MIEKSNSDFHFPIADKVTTGTAPAGLGMFALLLLVCAGASAAYRTFQTGDAALFLTFSLGIAWGIFHTGCSRPEKSLFVPAFTIVLCLNCLFIVFGPAADDLVLDELFFYSRSLIHADNILQGHFLIDATETKYVGYDFFLAVIQALNHCLGGYSLYATKIMQSVLCAMMPIYVYRLADIVYGMPAVSRTACLLAVFFPIFYGLSVVVLRDTVIGFLSLVFAYHFLASARSRFFSLSNLPHFVILFLSAAAVWSLRDWSAIALMLLPGSFALAQQSRRIQTGLLLLVLVAIVAIYVDAPGFLENVDQMRHQYVSFSNQEADVGSLGIKVVNLPLYIGLLPRLIIMMYSPVPPWIDGTLSGILIALGAILFYYCIPFYALGFWLDRHNPMVRAIFIYSLLLLGGVALTSFEFRHKSQFYPLAIVLASGGFCLSSQRQLGITIANTVLIGLACVMYVILKITMS